MCYFIVEPNGFFLRRGEFPKDPQKWFYGTFKALNTTMDKKNSSIHMDKISKIRSQPAKCNVFCGTEASNVISSVTQYRITKNCDHHTHCSLLITIHYYGGGKIIILFSYHNVTKTRLKLEE